MLYQGRDVPMSAERRKLGEATSTPRAAIKDVTLLWSSLSFPKEGRPTLTCGGGRVSPSPHVEEKEVWPIFN